MNVWLRAIFAACCCAAAARGQLPGFIPTREAIAKFEARIRENPADTLSRQILARLEARLGRETGDFDATRRAEAQCRAVLALQPDDAAALVELAGICNAMHRPAEAREIAARLMKLQPESNAAKLVAADAEFALGATDQAARILEAMERLPAVDARLAELVWARGDIAGAPRAMAAAAAAMERESEIPLDAAGLHLRAGELFFRTGKLPEAETEYDAAAALTPGHWMVLDRMAKLRSAQERYNDAVEFARNAVAATPRPETREALGDLLARMGHAKHARELHEEACAAYRQSAGRGETLYLHHLAELFAGALDQPGEALKWAEKDFASRPNPTARAVLAWALHRNGRTAEADAEMRRALATGTADPLVLTRAGIIAAAAGDAARGAELSRRALEINPLGGMLHSH